MISRNASPRIPADINGATKGANPAGGSNYTLISKAMDLTNRRRSGCPPNIHQTPRTGAIRACRHGLLLLVLLIAEGCGRNPLTPTPLEPPTEATLFEYTGLVEEPHPGRFSSAQGVARARLTVLGGIPDGRTAVTDAEGRFSFPDYPHCELDSPECRARRFRVEKYGYETREVGANDPYWRREQGDSGTLRSPTYKRIVIGHEWPVDPRHPQFERMRRTVPAMNPLWYVRLADPLFNISGYYHAGVIAIGLAGAVWPTIVHEYCHGHQDWAADPNRYNAGDWEQSPEGQAYIEAAAADRAAGYTSTALGSRGPAEEAANVCVSFAYDPSNFGRNDLREQAPNRYRWAEEWLHRR